MPQGARLRIPRDVGPNMRGGAGEWIHRRDAEKNRITTESQRHGGKSKAKPESAEVAEITEAA